MIRSSLPKMVCRVSAPFLLARHQTRRVSFVHSLPPRSHYSCCLFDSAGSFKPALNLDNNPITASSYLASTTFSAFFSTQIRLNKKGRSSQHPHRVQSSKKKSPNLTSSSTRPSSLFDDDEEGAADDDIIYDPDDFDVLEESDESFNQLRNEFQTLMQNVGHAVFLVQPEYRLSQRELTQLGIGDPKYKV